MVDEKGEKPNPTPRKERQYSFEKTEELAHGTHRFTLKSGEEITALSAQTWPEYLEYLSQITDEDRLVVSPELMTLTGKPSDEIKENQGIIEARVEELKEISKKHSQALFLLGTPTFPGKRKPKNSVVFIQNGLLIGQTNKRSGATPEESESLDLVAEEPPALVPETSIGLLICSDLFALSLFDFPEEGLEAGLRLAGKENLINTHPTFIHPEAKSLLVVSCWGVGGNRQFMKGIDPNQYYLGALRGCAEHVFRSHPQINTIVQVDRTPLMAEEDLPFTPDHPFNTLYQRKFFKD